MDYSQYLVIEAQVQALAHRVFQLEILVTCLLALGLCTLLTVIAIYMRISRVSTHQNALTLKLLRRGVLSSVDFATLKDL